MHQFDKNSVVCFLGDSITANGGWMRRVYEYYRLEKNIPCKMYNCGVPGDRADHGVWRLEDTVFCYKPTDVVVAYGMNDCGIPLFKEAPLSDAEVMERRRVMDNSIQSLRRIAAQCKKRGIHVTFCTSSTIDELSENETPIYYGGTAALMELSLRVRAVAEEVGADLIDFTFPFREISLKLYKKGQTLVGPDRVHPLPEGHEFMARLFLKGQGFDVTVPETFEELQEMVARPHDPWEEQRRKLEMEANCNMYMDWDFGFGRKSREAMAEAIAWDDREAIHEKEEAYMANRDRIPALRQALIEFTNTVGKE